MIFVALGSNLFGTEFNSSQDLLETSLKTMKNNGIVPLRRSSWYRSAPVPLSDQGWFVNGVVEVGTEREPEDLLAALHRIEADYGRVRQRRNESRTLDLDLLAYDDRIMNVPEGLVLPHPRLQERAFVLLPLAELAPLWKHPVTGQTAGEMLAALPPGQEVERID